MRRAKSLRIGVHHADAVVWEPVCRTHLRTNVTIGGASEASSAGVRRRERERVRRRRRQALRADGRIGGARGRTAR